MDALPAPPGSFETDNPDRSHAVVIGSGFGGLAAAVRLGARGYRVSVLERLDSPGGRARVFRQDGFTFDAGPTIVTAPHLFEELWSLCGRRLSDDVAMRRIEPFYRIRFHDGRVFDMSSDPQAMRAEIARFSPADLPGYERFLRASERRLRIGFEQLGDASFARLWDMLRVAPALIGLRAWESVDALVARHVRDPALRIALGFHPLLVGGSPFRASSIYGLIAALERRWGVHFAMGGTGSLVSGLVGLIERQGGTVRCGAEVAEILAERGRVAGVRLASGEAIRADVVVSNADPVWTYRHMPAVVRRRWTDRRLARGRASMGLFVWYFGTDRRYDDVAHHMIILGPRHRALLRDIFVRHRLASDFSLYLHRPTATDPSLAPPGGDAFYVLSPVPNLRADVDWTVHARPYRDAVAHALEATVLPGLSAHVVSERLMTPLDFRDDYLSHLGAGFGLEPVLTQSAWFRPHNISEELDGLYLVGAGTHPGAGLPGVLSSAKVLDRVVADARVR